MQDSIDPSRLSFRLFAAFFAVLLAVASVPLWLSNILPLLDYPNHLARMYLLANLARSPVLQQFYAVAWRPVPNLAMDAIVPWASRVMPLFLAGKLFVLLTFFLLAGGSAWLHRVLFGRWSAWSCLAFLLLYSRLLLWGFLNDLFAVGLALWAFGAWIALRDRGAALRLALGIVFALILYFAHLMGLGVYGVLVGGYELGELWRRRARLAEAVVALLVAGLPFLPPLALLLLSSGSAGGGIHFAQFGRKLDLLFSVFDDYSRPFDVACFVLAVVALGAAYARGWLKVAPALGLPLILLFVAYLVMPSQLFTASGADRRLPLALFLVLIAGSDWVGPSRRVEAWLLSAAGLMFVLRMGVIAASWHVSGRSYGPIFEGLDVVPPGSRIAVAFPEGAVNVTATPLVHLPVLAIVRRDAFVPTLFAYRSQQPVALQPRYRALADRLTPDMLWGAFVSGKAPLSPDGQAALDDYDYVVFTDNSAFILADLGRLAPAFVTPRFQLFRVMRPVGATTAKP